MLSIKKAFSKQITNYNYRLIATKYTRSFEEIKIPVPWGHVAGKFWGPSNNRPILSIHGIQDNCGTFDRLIPLLNNKTGFLAIDLPGHGYSSRIPLGMSYNIIDYITVIRHVANYFEWPKISIMAHSFGAMTAFAYAMLYPEEVDYLICLDQIKPVVQKKRIDKLADSIKESIKYNELAKRTEEPPSYPIEVLYEKLATSNFESVDLDHCHYIVKRNSAPSRINPDQYYFTRDPRLKTRLVLNWSQDELIEGATRIKCPVLVLKYTESVYFEKKEKFYEVMEVLKKSSRDFQFIYIPGKHHSHLINPELASPFINDFIEKHSSVIDESHSKMVEN